MTFYIKVYERHEGAKWKCFARADSEEDTLNGEIVRNMFHVQMSNMLLLEITDCHDTKIVFYHGNYVVDKMIIPANPGISIQAFNGHVDKYLPELERKLARFINTWEQDKVLCLLEKMEKRNKKSK